jgi:hypothetical protein
LFLGSALTADSNVVARFSPRSVRIEPDAFQTQSSQDFLTGLKVTYIGNGTQIWKPEGSKMRTHWMTSLKVAAVLVLLFSAARSGKAQQGRAGASANPQIPIPRLSDGKPNLAWVDPRYKGTWHSGNHQDVAKDVKEPKDGIPFQPWGESSIRLSQPYGAEGRS